MKNKFAILLGALLSTTVCMPAYAFDDDLEFDELDTSVSVLVTPTRLKQSKHRIPASVSQINAEELDTLQIRTIPEALRYVAGMIVGYASGNQPRINYHGTNGLVPRRMQVLVDGISVYRSGYAEVVWPLLPITMDDVSSIEVTRSPSSVTYGQNSMMAVINIITKKGEQIDSPEIKVRKGGQDTQDVYVQLGGVPSEKVSYRLSLAREIDEGFDTNFRGENRHDGIDIKKANGIFNYKINSDTDVGFFAARTEGTSKLEYRDSFQVPGSFPDMHYTDDVFRIDLRHAFSSKHELKFNTYYTNLTRKTSWRSCQPQAFFLPSLRELDLQNEAYAAAIVSGQMPSGGTAADDALAQQVFADIGMLGADALLPICVTPNMDFDDVKIDYEIQDTYIVSDNLRFVFGGGASQQKFTSETYVNGTTKRWSARLFGNMEYQIDDFVLNVGAMIEDEKTLKEAEVSPRFGLNYRLSPSNTIRYSISRAVRTPDILETTRDWNFYLRDMDPALWDGRTEALFYHNARAEEDLDSETIVAQEIALFGHHTFSGEGTGTAKLEYDFKLFYEDMDDLISEKLQYFDYHPTNDSENTLKGLEFEIDYSIKGDYLPDSLSMIKFHLNYAYIDMEATSFFEESLYARNSGAAYSIFQFHNGYYASFAMYGNSKINGENFAGYELGGGKTFRFSSGELELALKAVHWPDKVNEFTVSETFNVQNNNDETTNFYLTASYKF